MKSKYLIILLFLTIATLCLLGYKFIILPDEVFEIKINSKTLSLDTVYIPKKYDNVTICKKIFYYCDDTVILNNMKVKSNNVSAERCGESFDIADKEIKISYRKYKADSVKIEYRYEYFY